jgi:HSP20 family molecular chaperone IbpA
MSLFSSPMLLGFEEIERLIDRASKGGSEGYPPYNVERVSLAASNGTSSNGTSSSVKTGNARNGAESRDADASDILRITLAVAGFTRDELEITIKDSQLVVHGRQQEDKSRDYLYRGIAARQFTRTFVLADGIEVRSATLANGLLSIDLERPEPERKVRTIVIGDGRPEGDR